jgi:fumarylpyruvate hydrolase
MTADSRFLVPPTLASIEVAGDSRLFPMRRIYCVGLNYAAHAREMGKDGARPPCFFSKPADAVAASGGRIPYPTKTGNLHHEIELVVAIGSGGSQIAREAALSHVIGYAAGIDLTRRDLQSEARSQGEPWDLSKGFDNSAPVGALALANAIGHPARGAITLAVNGSERQRGDLGDMIWSVADIIAALSQFVALAPGDLIFTGTPPGVGPALRGDRLYGAIDGVGSVVIDIAA